MRAYTNIVQKEGKLTGLEAYSASRPPHSEGLAVSIASYLAHETGLPTINLLHLSSAKALEAALTMARRVPAHRLPPRGDDRPPARRLHAPQPASAARSTRRCVRASDVEALWQHLADGHIDWVVSDHACCKEGPEVRRRRATTCSRRSPASAAPSTCWPA